MDGVKLLAVLTLFSNIFILYLILLYVLRLIGVSYLWNSTAKLLIKYSIHLSFAVSLTATLGSLYFSEVRGFTPCILCWYQRILMYPEAIILGTALFKKRTDVFTYILPLSVFGLAIAVYHYYIQLNPNPLVPCTTVGFSVSCTERFTTTFGYITIPFMSLSAFLLISVFGLIKNVGVVKD